MTSTSSSAIVGIVANPAAGKDIRRIVAQGRFVPDHEKVNILERVLAGLDALGVGKTLFMPDSAGIGRSALERGDYGFAAEFVDTLVFNEEGDSARAARAMRDSGAACIVTLGGDGTNRIVARECGEVPILPISTGTNNVFPTTLEGTIAGLAAGAVAIGLADRDTDADKAISRHKRLEIHIDGDLADIALVDLAVSTERFVGARAVWDVGTLSELFLTRAAPTAVGLSSIGAQLRPTLPDEPVGLHIEFARDDASSASNAIGARVIAPIAPGSVRMVDIARWSVMRAFEPGMQGVEIALRPATVALDGERAFSLKPGSLVEVRLSPDGPNVVDAARALDLVAESGGLIAAKSRQR